MIWQVFTAFGTICGCVAGVIFQHTVGLDGFPYLGSNHQRKGCFPYLDYDRSPNPDFSMVLSKDSRCVSTVYS